MTNLAYLLAALAGPAIAVLTFMVWHRPSRKHWLRMSCQSLGIGLGMWLGRFLFLGSYYVLLWVILFSLVGGIAGLVGGWLLENRLKLNSQ